MRFKNPNVKNGRETIRPDSFTDLTNGINILPPGQNGLIDRNGRHGPHYDDQLCLYTSFRYKSMRFFNPLQDPCESVLEIKPGTKIYRDSFGVPHIFSTNEKDLAFAAGFAVAQDRLFQMDLFRWRATGRLAEFLNDDFPEPNMNHVEADKIARRDGYSLPEQREILDSLPNDIGIGFWRFSEGVNCYIEEVLVNRRELPVEYVINGIVPQLWRAEDSIAILGMMARTFGSAGGYELLNAGLIQSLIEKYGRTQAEKMFQDILYRNDPAAPTTISPEEGAFPYRRRSGKIFYDWFPSDAGSAIAIMYHEMLHGQRMEEWLGMPRLASNAIAVSAKKSSTGNALLFGGPQMGYSVPQIVVEVGLHAGSIQARGITFPGVGPFVLIGHGAAHAWTLTSGLSDAVDTYAEKLHPKNREQYSYLGKWNPMEKRTETIVVKSLGERPSRRIELEVFRTIHGPVVLWDEKKPIAYSIKHSFWKKEAHSAVAFHALNRGSGLETIRSAIREVPVSFNLLYANSSGHIAYWHLGKQPIRPAQIEDRLPVPGTGEYEWKGFVPFDEMPHVMNPTQGWLANWNNKPSVGWSNGDWHEVQWGKNHRVQALIDFLSRRNKISFQDLLDITHRVSFLDIRTKYFKPLLIQALRSKQKANKKYATVIKILEEWDNLRMGIVTYDTPAVAIFDTWWKQIMSDVFETPFGSYCLPDFQSTMERDHANMLLHVLEGRRSSVKPHFDYLTGRSRNEAILSAMDKALISLDQQFGEDMSNWKLPVIRTEYDKDGAGKVPEHLFMNRGTYCQVIEIMKK